MFIFCLLYFVASWTPYRLQFVLQENLEDLEDVFQITQDFYSNSLFIQRSKASINWNEIAEVTQIQNCSDYILTDQQKQEYYEADMILFVWTKDIDEKTVASTSICILESIQARPIFGRIKINRDYFIKLQNDVYFESMVKVMLHEVMHGIAIINPLWNYYRNPFTGKKYNFSLANLNNSTLYLPQTVIYAQKHFNCSTIDSIKMENQGSSANEMHHFERTVFYDEIFTSTTLNSAGTFSEFSFLLMEDTGWYRLGITKFDSFLWGWNAGCDFYYNNCTTKGQPEFCEEEDKEVCSYDRTTIAKCQKDRFGDKCLYKTPLEGFDCRYEKDDLSETEKNSNQHFGRDSICVDGIFTKKEEDKDRKAGCYQYRCDDEHRLTLIIDGQEYDCSKGLQNYDAPEEQYGHILCPVNPVDICKSRNECKNFCNKKGFCMGGICHCQKGYYGEDCSDICVKYKYRDQCLEECPENTVRQKHTMSCLECLNGCKSCDEKNGCINCLDDYEKFDDFCIKKQNKEEWFKTYEQIMEGEIRKQEQISKKGESEDGESPNVNAGQIILIVAYLLIQQ